MPVDVFIGVDGTGPSNNGEYATAFASSFVRQLANSSRFVAKFYSRGPTLTGEETGRLANWAAACAMGANNGAAASGGARIYLGGYSRGGASVLAAAHLLRARSIPVHGLLLFDAVDRTPTVSTTHIPNNVQWCRHAMRDPSVGSRTYFGNCGTDMEPGVNALRRSFVTTHGGMGGTPFGAAAMSPRGRVHEMEPGRVGRTVLTVVSAAMPLVGVATGLLDMATETNITPTQEAAGSTAVWAWMSGQLTAYQAQA